MVQIATSAWDHYDPAFGHSSTPLPPWQRQTSSAPAEVITTSTGGVKFDADKPRTDLLDPRPLLRTAAVLAVGARKYAARNWEKGMAWSRVYAALMRHMLAWWGGQDKDPETGLSHLDHAACCLHFLQTYEETHREHDDRPTTVHS